jgi:hypothetical protein
VALGGHHGGALAGGAGADDHDVVTLHEGAVSF